MPIRRICLLRFQWWNLEPDALVEVLPLLCDPDLEKVKQTLQERLSGTNDASEFMSNS